MITKKNQPSVTETPFCPIPSILTVPPLPNTPKKDLGTQWPRRQTLPSGHSGFVRLQIPSILSVVSHVSPCFFSQTFLRHTSSWLHLTLTHSSLSQRPLTQMRSAGQSTSPLEHNVAHCNPSPALLTKHTPPLIRHFFGLHLSSLAMGRHWPRSQTLPCGQNPSWRDLEQTILHWPRSQMYPLAQGSNAEQLLDEEDDFGEHRPDRHISPGGQKPCGFIPEHRCHSETQTPFRQMSPISGQIPCQLFAPHSSVGVWHCPDLQICPGGHEPDGSRVEQSGIWKESRMHFPSRHVWPGGQAPLGDDREHFGRYSGSLFDIWTSSSSSSVFLAVPNWVQIPSLQ